MAAQANVFKVLNAHLTDLIQMKCGGQALIQTETDIHTDRLSDRNRQIHTD